MVKGRDFMIIAEKFSTEERNLMSIFDTNTREALQNELVIALQDIDEPEMIELFSSTLEKLDTITGEDFAAIGFYIADEETIDE